MRYVHFECYNLAKEKGNWLAKQVSGGHCLWLEKEKHLESQDEWGVIKERKEQYSNNELV